MSDKTEARDLSCVLALTNLATPSPFANVWLDAVSACVFENLVRIEGVELAHALEDAISLLDAELDDSAVTAATPARGPLYGSVRVSASDITMALAHGIGRACLAGASQAPGCSLGYAKIGGFGEILNEKGDSAVTIGSGTSDVFVPVAPLIEVTPDIDSHRAILVSIGRHSLNLPNEIFSEEVFIDDRPTAGGGLPDLWQAALAQIVSAISANPNVRRVIIAGNVEHAEQTRRRLEMADQWDKQSELLDSLSSKLGMPTTPIRRAGERIGSRVVIANSGATALPVLLQDLIEGEPLECAPPPLAKPSPPRFRRNIRSEDIALGADAGCKVSTAFEAFPIALDVVRQHSVPPMKDQSGRPFRELIDFRIHLTTPGVDPVPRYYLDELDQMESYFQQCFREANGLFRASLDRHDQLTLVLDHVANTLEQRGYTSRRALLVVPHITEPGEALSPLGLVSVRFIPRSVPGGAVLDYSFTWRTVECLVGLPYSLFGSIRFAQYLTEEVRDRLASGLSKSSIRMGELSYIAHSLHIFLNDYAERIARKIVSDDTD